MNPARQRVVVKLGGKILTAWGLNDTAVREGSFEQMVDDHFEALQDTVHLREGPRQQALHNESWGVISTLRTGLQAVEENYRQFMHMQPDQLLVEGSTTAVTRSLLPFIQEDSPYKRMRKTVAREKCRALKDLALAKHLWIQDDGVCMHSHVWPLTLHLPYGCGRLSPRVVFLSIMYQVTRRSPCTLVLVWQQRISKAGLSPAYPSP